MSKTPKTWHQVELCREYLRGYRDGYRDSAEADDYVVCLGELGRLEALKPCRRCEGKGISGTLFSLHRCTTCGGSGIAPSETLQDRDPMELIRMGYTPLAVRLIKGENKP